jgi:hypothetical protein
MRLLSWFGVPGRARCRRPGYLLPVIIRLDAAPYLFNIEQVINQK